MTKTNILVTGALGQIGSELTLALRRSYGTDAVLATDVRPEPTDGLATGPYARLDVTSRDAVRTIVREHHIGRIFHLAAILSAKGEQNPRLCWDVNIDGTIHVLDAALEFAVERVLVPTSIAVFGPESPRDHTPQDTIIRPRTMYGITKVTGELLGEYYGRRRGLDVRGLRYPGIISSETLPGGGTTDYAVEIFYAAVQHGRYECFVRADTTLPMMYMPDAIRAIMELADADRSCLRHPTSYNLAALSFSAGELASVIQRHIPEFTCTYAPDHRQAIADGWPRSIDDTAARVDWGWKPAFDLDALAADMITKLRERAAAGRL
jgi:nucleoside-diphosphate-sugar epimerase